MKQALLNTILCAITATTASLAWFAIAMVATGDSTATTCVVLLLAGVVLAGLAGLLLGRLRRNRITAVPVLLGWALSLRLTPAGASLMNPANAESSLGDKLLMIATLALFYAAGILCTLTAGRTMIRPAQ